MFHGDRWAAAFISTSGNAEAGLACLRALVPPIKSMPGMVFGHSAAGRLERIMRECAAGTAVSGTADNTMEYAIRFISLLVEKNCFKYVDSVLQKIEQRLDEQKGILSAVFESAVSTDSGFEEKLKRQITEQTGASQIKMKTRLVPELLGGYRLRFGGFYIDASLKGQLDKMAADLMAAAVQAGGV